MPSTSPAAKGHLPNASRREVAVKVNSIDTTATDSIQMNLVGAFRRSVICFDKMS